MAEIRAYQTADLEALKQLITELQMYELQFDAGRTEPTHESIANYVSHLLKDVEEKQGLILLATVGSRVSGLVAGYPQEELDFRDPYFYVAELVVSEDSRGQGIGADLVSAIEDVARSKGCTRVGISVLFDNTRSHDLYQRLGFRDYVIELIKEL